MAHPLLSAATSLLRELVSYNTEPARSNLDLIRWVERYLQEHDCPAAIKLDESGEKASLLATLGPKIDGGIILSGHTDVVSTEGQDWQTPPFALTEKDGKLYARGTCDMKGFIACVLAQVPALNAGLRRPIHIALSRDEEIGSRGMPDMLDLIRQSGLAPTAAIVGEPTQMHIVAGHKAGYEMCTVFTGAAAHSSVPTQGCSATVPAARLAVFLADLSDRMAQTPQPDSLFDPPHGVINVGVLRGGTAQNIVAGRCEVQWLYRPLPDDDANSVLAQVQGYIEETLLPSMQATGHPVQVETLTDAAFPGLSPQPDSPALALTQKLLETTGYSVAPFGADSGHFQQAGIPAVLVGPGNIAQAHKPDEFIEIAELDNCLQFLDKLRRYLS